MMFGAFQELKTLGINPGPIVDRTQKNLESISDGTGIRYGTDNNVATPRWPARRTRCSACRPRAG